MEIEASAKRRLADEYDAAQERGEVQRPGGDRTSIVSAENNAPTVTDLGLTRLQIHEARQIRDAEHDDPGIINRTPQARLAAGLEPTKAALRGPTGGGAEAPESPSWSESKVKTREGEKRATTGLRRHDG